ncbi:MAG: hypothetical protein AAGE01_23200 [Pseudomonadota bacterium]
MIIAHPETSTVDVLLSAEVVVLARENPDEPFALLAIEVLKGDLRDAEIDLFLNSRDRRRLKSEPDRSLVLALVPRAGHRTARAIGSRTRPNEWRSIGYATEAYETLIRDILHTAQDWQGPAGVNRRATYFMARLTHSEQDVRELAYLEVGLAPYDAIRRADAYLPDEQLQMILADRWRYPQHGLAILLLGVNASPAERASIRGQMASSARLGWSMNLSAWATAFIEADGLDAIDWLDEHYLTDPGRAPEVVAKIVKSMSEHGNRGESALRARIVKSLGALIDAHPSLAGQAATDLAAWGEWGHAERFRRLRQHPEPMDGAAALAIDRYLQRAGRVDSMVAPGR